MKLHFTIIFLLLSAFFNAGTLCANVKTAPTNAYGFWENNGQVLDQNGATRSDVLFVLEQNGFAIALGKDFFSYQFTTVSTKSDRYITNESVSQTIRDEPPSLSPREFKYERTDVTFLGANKQVKIITDNISEERRNYYTTAGSFNNIHHYQTIRYQNLYPGIDLVFYIEPENGSAKSRLKYDFVIQPDADMQAIQLAYAGASQPTINENGELISLFPSTSIVKESKPLSYFNASTGSFFIPYQSKDHIISFKSVARKKNQVLTIDPEINWSCYLGGPKDELIESVDVDGAGNIYSCGQTSSTSGIVTTGAYQVIKQGVSDCFITKMNASGTIEWSTYFGGEAEEIGLGMCLDGFGNFYLCGQTRSLLVMSTAGAYQEINFGLTDAFVSKFDTSGHLIWSTFFGGTGKDQAYSCIADQTGVYMGGYTESPDHIATAGAQQTIYAGAGDAFISGFSASGALLFSTYLGGSDQDRAHDIYLDHFGNLMISGTTPSADGIALGNVHQTEVGGNNDVFVAKYSKSGVKKWCTYYGGLKTERGREIICDGAGNTYITGPTASGLYMATEGVHQTQLNGSGPASSTVYEDAYVAKFDSSGKLIWGTYFGGSGDEIGSCIKLLPGGMVLIGGTTLSDSLISTPDAIQQFISGKRDAFLAIFSDKGQLLWSTYMGGLDEELYDDGYAPALDVYNNQQLTFGLSTMSPGLGTLNNYTPSNNATPTADALFVNIDLGCIDRYEPNNTFAKAYPLGTIAQNKDIDGLVNYAGDRDYFKFSKTSDLPLKIYLSNLAQNCDIILYDSLFHPIKISHHPGLGDEEVSIKKTIKGTFYVVVFNPGNNSSLSCYNLSFKKIFGVFKEEAEREILQTLLIYPNPAHEKITVSAFSLINESTSIRIVDMEGRIMKEIPVQLNLGENIFNIDIQHLQAGSYLLYVVNTELPVLRLVTE